MVASNSQPQPGDGSHKLFNFEVPAVATSRSDAEHETESSSIRSDIDTGTTAPNSPRSRYTAPSTAPSERGHLIGGSWGQDLAGPETRPPVIDLLGHESLGDPFSLHPIDRAAVGGQGFSLSPPLQDCLFAEQQDDLRRGKGFFVPIKRLEHIIREENVVQELERCFPNHSKVTIRSLASDICAIPTEQQHSYRLIFAILVLIDKADWIQDFIGEKVHDGDLPLFKIREPGKQVIRGFGREPGGKESPRRLKCFGRFPIKGLADFEEYQWVVLAPVFERPSRKDVKYYDLHDQVILPFTKESESHEVCHGGFGQVSKVQIHPEHHGFGCDNQFAIKQLNSQDEQAFMAEFDMLSKFSDDTHDHLISVLAAYRQLKYFYLIFPWAEANLVQFWVKIKPDPDFGQTVDWVAKQCEGLADGLRQIHRYESFRDMEPGELSGAGVAGAEDRTGNSTAPMKVKLFGRHGDIKPANILWFPGPNGGMLKLTDFGLSEFHTLKSRSNRSNSRIATSLTYRPPECDMKDGKISRSYDIWTLGCLYLEFITWLLGGWDLVVKFTIMRATGGSTSVPGLHVDKDNSFFELQAGGEMAKIKTSVRDFIRVQLHGHPSCSSYIHEFLNLIEKEMLVVETGDTSSDMRINCTRLHNELQKMRRKCGQERGYALTPLPTRKS
ncbi:kinase-like protein [Parathielavia hyrcaniae]|uniref:Kinase-like protein n=1 Tax=Parathielavia hyrcaniae TaxID=113614 RepID=A0AAN6Q4E3_9PEZI|nr:kinase-like protein [Parathielavia hyrcaniae]